MIRRIQPDQVWCNTALSAVYLGPARAAGRAALLYSHEQAHIVESNLRRNGVTAQASFTRDGVVLVGCSRPVASTLARYLDLEPSRVETLYSPVDIAHVVEQARAGHAGEVAHPLVVACGLGNEGKGLDVFVDAAKIASLGQDGRVGREATWCWVGRVAGADRDPAVTFIAEVPTAVPWLAAADVVVLPSRADSFPLVVLEAMALGRPVVSTDLEGPREQLGDAGVFVPAGDPVALADAVAELLDDPVGAARLGAAARHRCEERWDIPRFRRRVAELVEVVGRVA